MNITVLPYIDPSKTEQVNQTNKVPSSATSQDTAKNFSVSLEAAEKAIAAITVDLVVSQDADRIKEAAAILNASSAPKLQALGQELLNSLEASMNNSASNTVSESSSGKSPAVYTPVSTENRGSDTTDTSEADDVQSSSGSVDSTTASSVISADTASISSALDCPEELQAYFEEAAETYNVDIALLESIAKAESNFRTDAVSSAGAIGIMQLMPATASGLNVEDSYDAYQNIMGGAKLISSLLEKYDGDKTLALAAYNAGSGNVAKYGGIPPFEETQNYITRVLGYYETI